MWDPSVAIEVICLVEDPARDILRGNNMSSHRPAAGIPRCGTWRCICVAGDNRISLSGDWYNGCRFWSISWVRFLVPFLRSIFDPFLANSQSRICLFYGTFSISRCLLDPFSDDFLTVHLTAVLTTSVTRMMSLTCLRSHPDVLLVAGTCA
jgi:hypothetical protein